VILPRAAARPGRPSGERCVTAHENRVRPVNERAAAARVRSPGGTTGSTHWYL